MKKKNKIKFNKFENENRAGSSNTYLVTEPFVNRGKDVESRAGKASGILNR